MAPASRQPSNWDDYNGRVSPHGSLTSSALGEEQALLDDDGDSNFAPEDHHARARRR